MTVDHGQRTVWAGLARPFATGVTVTLGGLAAIGLGIAFSNLSTVLISITFALFAALGLDPVVRNLERRGITRGWAITTIFTGLLVVLIGVLLLVLPTLIGQITHFVTDIPRLITGFLHSSTYAWMERTFGADVGSLISEIEAYLIHPHRVATIGRGVLHAGNTVFATASGLVIVLVLSLYFLASLSAIKTGFIRLLPARSRAGAAALTEQITGSVGGYLGGMVVLAFCNSIVAFVLHVSLRLPFPMLMAVVAFCITLIPLVGSVLYWGLATVIALFTGPVAALVFAIVYLVYMQIEAYVLTPRVMSRVISVPGALVVIGAIVGGTLLGLLGALIAIPVTASLLLIAKQVFIPQQDAKV
ncbi:permease [Microbacterium sp. Root61]|uniref:AI-2E family transporter n=1 Tax=Microbacterium sp. Root61 TaxID=1736570 RepID=UPI000701032D|nr:AI-2E family transporter [Microbacterium sp. Root61]KRA24867.1 permease [Microbacterium sp. Root61]